MPNWLASLLFALLAYTLYGTALVLMKVGAEAVLEPRRLLTEKPLRKKGAVWVVGVACNTGFAAVLAVALGLGRASVVAALNGFALVVVAGLSRVLLGERLRPIGLLGCAAIMLGVAAVGLGAGPGDDAAAPKPVGLWTFTAAVVVVSVIATVVSRNTALRAATMATAAGALGGIAVVLQKVAVAPMFAGGDLAGSAWQVATAPPIWAWAVTASGSFAVLQLAYKTGRAVLIAPLMTSAMIVVPVVGGAVVLREPLSGAHLFGAVAMIVGVVWVARGEPAAEPEPAAEGLAKT